MIRSILAIVVGLLVAFILILLVQTISVLFLFPMPPGLDRHDHEAMREYIHSLPDSAFLPILLAYFLGTFCGVALAVRIARRAPAVHALIVCGPFLFFNLMNLQMHEHPIWFWIASFVTFPVASLLGYLVSRRSAHSFGL